jgi:2-hydroxychromene-2-carboxylate isomerase
MSLEKADLAPYAAKMISSPRLKQLRWHCRGLIDRAQGRSNRVDVFLNPADPFSYLLVQTLGGLQARFDVVYSVRMVFELPQDMFPELDLWQAWAMEDTVRLAEYLGLDFPQSPVYPSTEALQQTLSSLLVVERHDDAVGRANTLLADLWHQRSGTLSILSSEDRVRLATNERQLRQLGHYQGSMLHFRGEWFWGVDRLDHLEARLIEAELARQPGETPQFTTTWAPLAENAEVLSDDNPARQEPLEIFFSIRSPYSYLGLERAAALARAYGIALRVRPVLPMLMRNQPVPDAKKWYIFLDTKREAEKLGIPYGFVADPLGAGVERCYALFDYACREGREVDYLLTYARVVNAQGIRSETDRGLRQIVEGAGLDWQKAKPLLAQDNWRDWAETNCKAMYEMGLWGVPSFHYAGTTCWGQDRLWRIEAAIRTRAGLKPAP